MPEYLQNLEFRQMSIHYITSADKRCDVLQVTNELPMRYSIHGNIRNLHDHVIIVAYCKFS